MIFKTSQHSCNRERVIRKYIQSYLSTNTEYYHCRVLLFFNNLQYNIDFQSYDLDEIHPFLATCFYKQIKELLVLSLFAFP